MRIVLFALLALGMLALVLHFGTPEGGPATSVLPSGDAGVEPSRPQQGDGSERRRPDLALEPADVSAAPAPRNDGASYREPGGDEWQSFIESTAPRVVAGRVLRGVDAVDGARVRIWPADLAWVRVPVAAREAETDARGSFRFESVSAGEHYVRADDGDERTQTRVEVDASERGRSVLLLFGRSVVEGVVHDERGGTLAGVPIGVAGIGPLPSRAVYTDTDAAGRFRVGGLVAGRYHVQADRGGEFDAADQRMVSLEVADRAEVVFGRTLASVRWTSRFVDGRGDAIPGERMLTFRHAERGDERRAWTDEDASFELQIEPGRWIAYLGDGFRRSARVGEIALERTLETAALVHEPSLLIVTLRANDAARAPQALLERAQPFLLLRPLDGASEARDAELHLGALHWLAVAAGEHELLARPPLRLVGGDPDRFALTIVAGEATHELTLEVTLE